MAIITDEHDVDELMRQLLNKISSLKRRGRYQDDDQSYTTISSREVRVLVLGTREEMKQMFKRKQAVYD